MRILAKVAPGLTDLLGDRGASRVPIEIAATTAPRYPVRGTPSSATSGRGRSTGRVRDVLV